MTPPAPDATRPYRGLDTCPVCGGPPSASVYAADAVPALCNVLFDTEEEARAAATGSIDLVRCGACGLLWNSAFDETLVAYTPGYENSLHFSPQFQEFATGLAADLVERHGLAGRTALELGSGKGDFLALLCDAGAGAGIGYDPSYGGETPPRHDLRFVPTLFPDASFPDTDFVCARHVFEHLSDPAGVLRRIRAAIPPGRRVGFYIEVPDGTYLLREVALWDVIYEHPLHFTAPAMGRLFADAGLAVTRSDSAFGGQYLAVEGTTAQAPENGGGWADGGAVAGLAGLADRFASRSAALRAAWADRLAPLLDRGRGVALWGAGSKGVSFLASVPGADRIRAVVDVNPRKHGRHVPMSGQQILAPDALDALRPHSVVLLNPIYRAEVAASLDQAGVAAELVTDPLG